MFNWSRQQAETLYYNSGFLIYSLVVVYIAVMFKGAVQKCARKCVCLQSCDVTSLKELLAK